MLLTFLFAAFLRVPQLEQQEIKVMDNSYSHGENFIWEELNYLPEGRAVQNNWHHTGGQGWRSTHLHERWYPKVIWRWLAGR